MSPVFPLTHTIHTQTAEATTTDRFGNTNTTLGPWQDHKVFGWETSKNTETAQDSILRTIDRLALYAPPTTNPGPGGRVKLPDGTIWEVDRDPDDYNNNPFFTPDLIVIHAKKVEG